MRQSKNYKSNWIIELHISLASKQIEWYYYMITHLRGRTIIRTMRTSSNLRSIGIECWRFFRCSLERCFIIHIYDCIEQILQHMNLFNLLPMCITWWYFTAAYCTYRLCQKWPKNIYYWWRWWTNFAGALWRRIGGVWLCRHDMYCVFNSLHRR